MYLHVHFKSLESTHDGIFHGTNKRTDFFAPTWPFRMLQAREPEVKRDTEDDAPIDLTKFDKGDLYSTNRSKSQSKSLKNSSIFGDSVSFI